MFKCLTDYCNRLKTDILEFKEACAAILKTLRSTLTSAIRHITLMRVLSVGGLILITYIAARAAYIRRGYLTFGGEYLIVPLCLMLYFVKKELQDD